MKEKLHQLLKKDFYAFKNKNCFFAMTAHIIYKNIDKKNPATHSKKIIDIIRNKIKFRNILIPDDISMGGLTHSIETSSVGRSIGTLVGEALFDKYPDRFC